MPKRRCHFCEDRPGLIVFPNGDQLCAKCHSQLFGKDKPLPPVIRKQLKHHAVIDIRGTMEYIFAQLACNFIHNGMSVSEVARQFGVERCTIYAKLRKFDLIRKGDEDKIRLNPTIDDFALSGGFRKKKGSARCSKLPK